MIKVAGLSAKYGELVAVDDVSFEIDRNEVVGLLGHNGAGKSTIMKILTGYLEPSQGNASINGLDVTANRTQTQQLIGYLPENCPLYPEMRVVEYLEHIAQLRGVSDTEIQSAIRRAVERTWLQEKALDPIHTLSRGYKQRVGVAQAILHSPSILILDEPTNGLDPSQIEEMRQLIRDLSKSATVILSTHILQEVAAVCSRVLIMNRGKLALDSALADIRGGNQLVVAVNADLAQLKSLLAGISDLGDISLLGENNLYKEYQVDIADNLQKTAANISKKVVEGGLQLYSIHPRQRSLESVFREVSIGS